MHVASDGRLRSGAEVVPILLIPLPLARAGVWVPPVSWSDLLNRLAAIIEQANSELTMIDRLTFGGGTHDAPDGLESFNMNIFLDDPQLLPYLNPKTQGYALGINQH